VPLVRFSVACLVALTFLGSSYAVAGGPIPGKPAKPAAQVVVAICAGDATKRENCGPGKGFSGRRVGDSFPQLARQAGTLSASRPMNFRCPGACQGKAERPVTVTIRALPRRDGYHKFGHWEGACERAGTVPTCTVRVQGAMTVTAVFTSNG